MTSRRSYAAFTLLELITVIAIIGIVAALSLPMLSQFRKGDAMLGATRQMLGAVSRARQLAISQHTTVYMVFVAPNFWTALAPAQRNTPAATNIADKQFSGIFFVALRTVGDQPGRNVPRYLSSWHALPESTFIAQDKFYLTPAQSMVVRDPNNPAFVLFNIAGFDLIAVPFPTEESPYVNMPCIAFDYLGRPVTGRPEDDEYIPLAHGSVLYAKDPATKAPLLSLPSVQETPPGNSSNVSYNVIRIDRLTGRPRLERMRTR